MEGQIIVDVHLSSVFASSAHVTTHAVPSTRRDVRLASASNNLLNDHASHASIFHSRSTGDVLIRIVQGGFAIELLPLSHDASPVRFVFQAAVVPSPSLIAVDDIIYLIALTEFGSLYCITLSGDCYDWHEQPHGNWYREWQVRKLASAKAKLLHVHDYTDVVIALTSGGYLRLYATHASSMQHGDHWMETEWKLSNWYSVSTLFPGKSTNQEDPTEIISMATLPLPTDVSDLFTLSRDRILRRWTIAKGCRAEIDLGFADLYSDPVPLLDARPQKLLQVIVVTENTVDLEKGERIFLLTFIPTPASNASGGVFRLFDVSGHQWCLITTFEASSDSAQRKLQDFAFSAGKLYVLWEMQGQSMQEMTFLNPEQAANLESQPRVWYTARPTHYNALSQDTIDDVLLRPGSLSDKFLQAILRPAVFSIVTLRTALQEYKDHYLSLPGPHPDALVSSHATLSESIVAVVGSTVQLTSDPKSGVVLHRQYWNALRRDWEGFVARCNEIERSSRWPVCLGTISNSEVLIVERERLARCIDEDLPLRLYRLLTSSHNLDPVYSLLSTCWALRSKLSKPLLRKIETEVVNIFGEELAFPLADLVGKASSRIFSRDELDEDFENWMTGRLGTIGNFKESLRVLLDIIGGLDMVVKQEEDEVELIIPPTSSEWTRALVASYISESVEVRYEFCLACASLLFFMGEGLQDYNPTLIAEAFSVIKGVLMLRYLCQQSSGNLDGTRPSEQETISADDVVTRLNNMHMSRAGRNPLPTYSLIHRLLSESGHPSLISNAAHHFLDHISLFAGESPAQVARSEMALCEKLRLLGHRESLRKLLAWLPRAPAVCYILGRLWIDVGRDDEAAFLLRSLGGGFGSDCVLSRNDKDALTGVLPAGILFQTECEYYLHVAELFRVASLLIHEVGFTKLALSVWTEDLSSDASVSAWSTVIKGYTDLGLYEDAYCALISSPHVEQQHTFVSHLVYRMCENDAIARLLSMNFREIVQQVEISLSFKASNADPRSRPNWAQILYTWYTMRGDHRNAALTMYIRARRLLDLQAQKISLHLSELQSEALGVALNALALVGDKNAYIVVPSQNAVSTARGRRQMDGYIPLNKFNVPRHNAEVMGIDNIEKEYVHISATVELLRRYPSLIQNGEPPLTPWTTVSKLTQAGLFDLAMHTAKALSIDMCEIFQRLADLCWRLANAGDASLTEVTHAEWLLTDKTSSWAGSAVDRSWRYLRRCLEIYDSSETDYSYSKAALETLLSYDPSIPPPPWLVHAVDERQPEYVIRILLRYGGLEDALERTIRLVHESTIAWTRTSSVQSASTYLPYSIIDSVLLSTEDCVSPRAQKLRQTLQTVVTSHCVRLQKHCGRWNATVH